MNIPLKISATEHLNGFSTGLVGASNVSIHVHTYSRAYIHKYKQYIQYIQKPEHISASEEHCIFIKQINPNMLFNNCHR